MSDGIHFAHPLWLAVGLLICVSLGLLLRQSARRQRQRLERFVSGHIVDRLVTNLSPARRRLRLTLLLLALFSCFVALARPQYGYTWQEVRQRGIDILLAVDTSKSMLTPDIPPNRLTRAKLAIRDFVKRLTGDRIGLLPFAGSAFLFCPLTTDYQAFVHSLDALDTELIPRPGTDIAAVIREAARILTATEGHKFLILVTDGENLEGDVTRAAEQARAQRLTIFTVGVGTPEGELIPQGSSFLKDDKGRFVTSKLDQATLRTIARITGGLYVPLGSMGQGFDTIYEKKLAMVPKKEQREQLRKVPKERFAWPLALGLLLLTLEYLIGSRAALLLFRNRFRRSSAGTAILLALLLALRPGPELLASSGETLLKSGRWEEAAHYYDKLLQNDPQNPRLHFNRGVVAYRQGQFKMAMEQFSQALASDDLQLQADSYYNLGNATFQLGRNLLATDPETTQKLWEKSLSSYDGSLQLDPDNDAAAFNRELVRKELEKLRRQKRNQRQQQNKKQEKEQQAGQENNKGSKDSARSEGKHGHQAEQPQEDSRQPEAREQKHQGSGRDNRASQPEDKTEEKTEEHQAAAQSGQRSEPDSTKSRQGTTMSRQDRDRRQQGRMTVGEARALLDSLAEEEKNLNFIPPLDNNAEDNPPRKDW